jgi:hypothetical protein
MPVMESPSRRGERFVARRKHRLLLSAVLLGVTIARTIPLHATTIRPKNAVLYGVDRVRREMTRADFGGLRRWFLSNFLGLHRTVRDGLSCRYAVARGL